MKLTNISLAILVALGLAACGGSDDNTPQTSDNQEAGHKNQTPTGGDETSTPPKDKSGLDPERSAPDLTVPKDLQTDVNVSKAAYLSRGFTDKALGYMVGSRTYSKKQGTDPADIKFNSIYNYSDEGDLVDSRSSEDGGVISKVESEGAIYVGQNPDDGIKSNAFVKIGNKYFRVKADIATGKKYTPETEFVLVAPAKLGTGNDNGKMLEIKQSTDNAWANATKGTIIDVLKDLSSKGYAVGSISGGKKFSQSEVVFIANAKLPQWNDGTSSQDEVNNLNESLVVVLGKATDFADNTGQTILGNISFLGNEYNPEVTGQSLDLSKLPVDKEKIQFVDVSSKFTIRNDKRDAVDGNNFSVPHDIELGKVKAYNLPYSVAYVTVDPSKKNEKNIFDLPAALDTSKKPIKGALTNASYQVRGYQTLSLPKQGRAHYTGKSFNERVEGDIKLTADFFEDRAGVHGIVTNRKDVVKDKALPNLKLDRLTLTDPEKHGTFAKSDLTGANNKPAEGRVHGDPKVDSWSVQFYGLEAQEAGGKLYNSNTDYEEVYTTQRGRLTNLSNTSDVK